VAFIVSWCFIQQTSWAYSVINASYQPQNVLLGRETRLDYVSRYHPGMNPNPPVKMYKFIQANFAPTDKVLLWGEEKAYPLNVRHTYCGVYDTGIIVRLCENLDTPEQVAAALAEQGITHLLINVYEANRIAGYGMFGMSPKAFGLFCAFWEKYLKIAHIEYQTGGQDGNNPIVLMQVLREPLKPNEPPIQNFVGPIYERNELNRLGIGQPIQLQAFYEEQRKSWPAVLFFITRLQELRQK